MEPEKEHRSTNGNSVHVMIERIVLFKLKDAFCNDVSRAEIAEHTRRTLGKIACVRTISVGVPADPSSEKSWDLSIVVGFDTLADLQSYCDDPSHCAYVDGYMRSRMEVIKTWNFERTE